VLRRTGNKFSPHRIALSERGRQQQFAIDAGSASVRMTSPFVQGLQDRTHRFWYYSLLPRQEGLVAGVRMSIDLPQA
jgi:hypothetical protein